MSKHIYPLRHHFIKASAGTGKTFTIMEILACLVDKEDLDLKKTLILTFTEKAAGELKERLRRKLIDSENDKLKRTVYELDEVMVATIHGFCKSILEEYPIETGYNENSVFKDETTRGAEALYQLEHNAWNGYWGDELGKRVKSSDYFKNKEKFVIPSINKLLSGREYRNPDVGFTRNSKLNPPELNSQLVYEFFKELTSLNDEVTMKIVPSFYAPPRKNLEKTWKILTEWQEFFNKNQNDPWNSEKYLKFLSQFDWKDINLDYDTTNFQKSIKSFSESEKFEMLNRLTLMGHNLKYVFGEIFEFLSPNYFFQETTLQAIEIANSSDPEEEWISFNAMISRLAISLETNPILLQSLRSRYQVGIIDEFQDTDSLQYSIFYKIFLEDRDPGEGSALYLIGDPKQSIYGFRGADIGTYLKAQNDIKNRLANGEKELSLGINYRSVTNLIHGYNEIFRSQHFLAELEEKGYPNPQDRIRYEPVNPPKDEDKLYELDPGFSEPPIQVVNLSGSEEFPIGNVRENWDDFIVHEISELIESGFAYQKKSTKNEDASSTEDSPGFIPQKIEYGDIAILVNSKSVGRNLLEKLKRSGIPASYYQEQGIYQSREVDQVLTILTCLQDSHNPSSFRKILLTDAFRIHPKDLELYEEHSIDSHEKRLLNSWRIHSEKREFAELFRSIEQESKIFFQEGDFNLAWERRSTNYRQIFRKLLELSQRGKPTLDELILELKKLKAISKTQEEKPLYEKETESSAVQILTVHASKGLEWPVVFLHSLGSARMDRYNFYDYPTASIEGNNTRIWNLSLWEKNNSDYDHYESNENKRKFYVGITRPKIRLYLPLFKLPTDKYGKSYPNSYHDIVVKSLQDIHSRMNSGESNLGQYFQFREYLQERESWAIDKKEKSTSHNSQLRKSQITQPSQGKQTSDGRAKSFNLVYSLRPIHPRLQISSYSSLKDWDNISSGSLYSYGKIDNKLLPDSGSHTNKDDEFSSIEPSNDGITTGTLIAPGAMAGNYLHNILENLEFEIFANSTMSELYDNSELREEILKWMDYFAIDKTSVARKYNGELPIRDAITRETIGILLNTMNAIVPIHGGNQVQIKDIPKKSTVREMPFHWNAMDILSTQIVKGSIDLVFEIDGKYYLADYKSNSISKDEDLRSHIEENDSTKYDLQRDIYSYAFFQYLKQCFPDEKTALDKFGGIYYFFLRIMEEGKETGIYVDKDNWSLERFQDIEIRIHGILKNWRTTNEK